MGTLFPPKNGTKPPSWPEETTGARLPAIPHQRLALSRRRVPFFAKMGPYSGLHIRCLFLFQGSYFHIFSKYLGCLCTVCNSWHFHFWRDWTERRRGCISRSMFGGEEDPWGCHPNLASSVFLLFPRLFCHFFMKIATKSPGKVQECSQNPNPCVWS